MCAGGEDAAFTPLPAFASNRALKSSGVFFLGHIEAGKIPRPQASLSGKVAKNSSGKTSFFLRKNHDYSQKPI
jgi:hypothetical protein